ncbi:MAG: hypothetical protein IJ716_08160 [Lachnospiraceae bacterium]|nr:hypothetical protein [Lachnospiraceae bacterium]
MLDKIIKRMDDDPERRFTGEYFKDRVADLRIERSDLNYGLCCGYISCLRAMGFITDEEDIQAFNEIGDIFTGRKEACEKI